MKSKQVNDYPNYTIYDNGTIFSTKRNEFLKPVKGAKHYNVRLYNEIYKNVPLHWLVMSHYGNDTLKTRYIKHLDGDTSNNDIANLQYCEFKELMNPNHVRKVAVKRTYVVSMASKIEAYKYYITYVPVQKLAALIIKTRYRVEAEMISKRWNNKKRLTDYEKGFKLYCSGVKSIDIRAQFNWSAKTYVAAFNAVRLQLIKEIMQDVENGTLIYTPTFAANKPKVRKTTTKQSLKRWNKFKADLS